MRGQEYVAWDTDASPTTVIRPHEGSGACRSHPNLHQQSGSSVPMRGQEEFKFAATAFIARGHPSP